MIESILRPTYQLYVVDPILRWARHYSPMTITYAACITGVMAAVMLVLRFPLIATLLLLISGFLDTLDGTVARAENKTSNLGSVLDIVSDRVVEFAMIFALFALDPLHRGGLTLAMLGSCYLCITSFLVVGIFTPNESHKGFHYSPGLIERAEAFLFFILMIWSPNYFSWFAYLFTSLVLLTSFLRIKQFMNLGNTE